MRFIGIDVGAETIKLVELSHDNSRSQISRREILEHGKNPGPVLLNVLQRWDWHSVSGAAVTGRFASQINLPYVPPRQAQIHGYHFHLGDKPATVVNIGSHGFTVLELRVSGQTVFRENSRCSQGTGNFLRQLVGRFSLTVEEASALCTDVSNPAQLSGRCPVILKTDMTHLANKGEERARILAGLFDAVCENVMVLIKPGVSPNQVLLTGGVSRSPRVRRVFGEMLAQQEMTLLTIDEEDALCFDALGCALIAAERLVGIPDLTDQGRFAEGPAELRTLLLPPREISLERLPALADSLPKVRRMPAPPSPQLDGELRRLVLGFDIGSTGSKLVAIDATAGEPVWEGYGQTLGDPVRAAQDLLRKFLESPAARYAVVAFGATGSGREVAGSLLTACYSKDAVFIVNEIVAHATGALHYDTRVDTIFEIGGQDAKYIRLAEGRIIDCAMNEACSAGTGSFIEEQGRKFEGIEDVRQLGRAALTARSGVSLGEHCSVFMAEVIDEAVAAGIEHSAIVSGLYDSIIKNYLNRVKGNRSVGKVIFCQGMPFSADALAAAVARQTGSEVIVPPNPGTVGALGIALLAAGELNAGQLAPLNTERFLEAKVEQKDTFVCASTRGCGGSGNRCRIDRLRTVVSNQHSIFTWGGGCSLHDKATRKTKLPDQAPDPFREREELLTKIIAPFRVSRSREGSVCSFGDSGETRDLSHHSHEVEMPQAEIGYSSGRRRVAMSDEFMLKGLLPFFAAFFHNAGFDLEIISDADAETLKHGIQLGNVPFCAPMRLFHGVTKRMADSESHWLFIPMLRSVPQEDGQRCSATCPIVQSAPDVMRWTLQRAGTATSCASTSDCGSGHTFYGNQDVSQEAAYPTTNDVVESRHLLAPIIDFDEGNFESEKFLASCSRLARDLGIDNKQWRKALSAGAAAQAAFDAGCRQIGLRALDFCRSQDIVPVVVLGRNYTIYNKVLNSNVPAILREQGAIGIPVDCYPISAEVPVFRDMYWGYGQAILRAAHQVRRSPGVYALYCSNYSCGPDSFNLHFTSYVMEGKPFAVIETDGHSGDVGTKTRVEAFLHCVDEDKRACDELTKAVAIEPIAPSCCPSPTVVESVASHGVMEGSCLSAVPNDFSTAQFTGLRLRDIREGNGSSERLLVPYIGPASEAGAAIFRGCGLLAESLPAPDAESLRLGRRYTSGKVCLPMPLTLGSLLQRLERAKESERFVYLMPSTDGPCRFGVYNLLNNIVLENLRWRDRVRIWSPKDTGYFVDMPAGAEILLFAGIVGIDLLLQALFDVRPLELKPGAAQARYEEGKRELLALLESAARGDLSLGPALWQVIRGNLFGIPELLRRAGADFAALRGPGERPLVELAGEIYVRSVEFSNDFIIEKLEQRGLSVHLAPKSEWVNYCSFTGQQENGSNQFTGRFSSLLQKRIQAGVFSAIAPHLGWPAPPTTGELMATAGPYVNAALTGEAVLTVGAPLHKWRRGEIDAVVNVGPLECMPTKIAEAQLHHAAEREGLLSLTLSFNGDPVDTAALDNFAFEVNSRFKRRATARAATIMAKREDFAACGKRPVRT